jgi:hypothetical protein
MDSLTLLAVPTNSNVRARSLRTDDERFALAVQAHEEQDATYLHLRAYLHDLGNFHLFIDGDGGLYATAIDASDQLAGERLRKRVEEEIGLEFTHPGSYLLAEHPDGKRRSVLQSGGYLSVRAKAYVPEDDEEESLLRLRVFVNGYGHIQLVISSYGRVLALMSGRTDTDVYNRVRGELARKGIELE